MVTFLRPLPHAHGPTAVDVRIRRSHRLHSPSSLLPCRCGCLTPMAEDPSHPHQPTRKDHTVPPSQQQPEQQLPPAPPSPPPHAAAPRTLAVLGAMPRQATPEADDLIGAVGLEVSLPKALEAERLRARRDRPASLRPRGVGGARRIRGGPPPPETINHPRSIGLSGDGSW